MGKSDYPKPEVPNEATMAAMEEARVGELPSFDSVDELLRDLNSARNPGIKFEQR